MRQPPHNLQMEQAVLAALMTVSDSWEQLDGRLADQDFYAQRHRHLFRAIQHLAVSNQPYDAMMVHDWLAGQHLSDEAGGEAYLMQLLSETPASLYNLSAYAEKVRELSILREIITTSSEVLNIAFDAKGVPVSDV